MNFEVKPIENNLAVEMVVKYHYLHRAPNRFKSFGLFNKDELIGVCIFGKAIYKGVLNRVIPESQHDDVYELTRVWVKDGQKTNTTSFFVSKCLSLIDRNIVISFADPHQGHSGVIYQACNFKYFGLSLAGITKKELNLTTQYHRKHLYVYSRNRKQHYKLEQKPFPKKQLLIYGLTCPDTGLVRYIGKSSSGLLRPNEHKKPSNLRYATHKTNWIKKLISEDKTYGVIQIEYCENEEELNDREIHWIAKYRQAGYDLTNSTDGGEGALGMVVTQSTKDKISKSRIDYYKTHPEKKEELSIAQRKQIVIIDELPHFHCFECDTLKLLDLFYKNCTRWNGHDAICKECAKIRVAARRPKRLSSDEFYKSYKDRRDAMSKGIKARFDSDPEYRKKISKRTSKPVEAHNPETGERLKFDSALKAKEKGFQNSNIGQAIKYKTLYKGYYWKFA